MTLLLKGQSALNEFKSLRNSISYGHVNQLASITAAFKASVVDDTADRSPITSLIVCTKSTETLKAIKSIADRITSQTNILFLLNGYGIVEELIENLWREKTPPTMFVAVNKNCVLRLAAFNICHHSGQLEADAIRIGQYPIQGQPRAHNCLLIQSLTAIPELHAAILPWRELLSSLYKKLIVNACINPLAGVLVCKNGKFVMDDNKHGIALMELLLNEAYQVLGNSIIGETYDSMLKRILDLLHETKNFSCSTVQDIKSKRITEIDYINGYVCKLGLERSISVKANQTLVELVHFKEFLYD